MFLVLLHYHHWCLWYLQLNTILLLNAFWILMWFLLVLKNIDVVFFSFFKDTYKKQREMEFDSILVEEALTTLFVGVVGISWCWLKLLSSSSKGNNSTLGNAIWWRLLKPLCSPLSQGYILTTILVLSYILKLQCMSVCLSRQCLENYSSHCPFPVVCFVERGGPVSWGISWFGNFDLCDSYYPTNNFEDLNRGGQNPW